MGNELIASVAPVARRVRAYFAPVNRTGAGGASVATVFDASGLAGFDVDAPPVPWVGPGMVRGVCTEEWDED